MGVNTVERRMRRRSDPRIARWPTPAEPPPEIDPTTYPAFRQWFDANDPSTFTLVGPFNPKNVSQWRPRESAAAFGNLDQGTTNLQPQHHENAVNGRDAVRFGVFDEWKHLNGGPMSAYMTDNFKTAYMVFRPDPYLHLDLTPVWHVSGATISVGMHYIKDDEFAMRNSVGGAPHDSRRPIGLSGGTTYLAVGRHNATVGQGVELELNGSAGPKIESIASSVSTLPIRVGGISSSNFYVGFICEMLFYAADHSDQNVSEISAWLNYRWGIS